MFVNFYGVVLKPGTLQPVCVQDETSSDEEEIDYRTSKTVHLTQLALPGSAKQGNHTVFLEDEDGESFVLGTLNINTCPNVKLDLPLVDQEMMLKVDGPSEVHVTGYEMVSFPEDDDDNVYDSEDEYDEYEHLLSDSEDDEDDEDDEDEDDDDVPDGIPLGMRELPSPDEDDEFDGDDISDSDIDMDGDDDDEDEDDDDDDDSDDDDDDDDDEDEDDDDDEEEESDSDEEEKEAARKRAAKLLTPQPSKKKKLDNAQAPATAPSKVSTKKAPTNEQEYTKALKEYLKEHGPSKLATLGSSIKRPPAVPKLKRFLSTHASDFVYNQSNDTVSLA